MDPQTIPEKTIAWNNVFQATLRAAWWSLKLLAKLILALASIVIAILVFLYNRDDNDVDDIKSHGNEPEVGSIGFRGDVYTGVPDPSKFDH